MEWLVPIIVVVSIIGVALYAHKVQLREYLGRKRRKGRK